MVSLMNLFYRVTCYSFCISVIIIMTVNRCHIKNDLMQLIQTEPSNRSPNVLQIIQNTRTKIKLELQDYNFTRSAVHTLKDLVPESDGRPVRTIIFSTWRSGSTFLGEILNAIPGNFYHYEPLLRYGIKQIREPPDSHKVLRTIENMLKCDFNGMKHYFEYGKNHTNQFYHNTRLWVHCKNKKELCCDANFTGEFCRLFPFQSMKVVRVRLRLVKGLLVNKKLNVKVVVLIRDPRGVMNSRRYRSWCRPALDCRKPEVLCADMVSDYEEARRVSQEFPDRIIVLRYEELALYPFMTTHHLLEFLKLSFTQSVEDFLYTHTNIEVADVTSTFRVSRDNPFKWKNVSTFATVEGIQRVCKQAMELWGYRIAHNASHLRSRDFYPLLPLSTPK